MLSALLYHLRSCSVRYFIVTFLFLVGIFFSAAQVYAVDPVAYWKFDETVAGQNADDAIGTNDGVPSGNPTPSTDVPPVSFTDTGSMSFDGNNYFQILRPVQDSFTICAWIKTTSSGGGSNHWESAPVMDSEWGGLANDFGFGVGNGGKLMYGNGGGFDSQVNGTTTINDNTWHDVCATRDNSTGSVKLYVDAHLDGSGTTSTGTLSRNPNARIGFGYDGAAHYVGLIDDVRAYNVSLSEDQLTSLAAGSDNPDLPVISSRTPADNATSVSTNTTLVATFSATVTVDTGNIVIKKSSDDSTVATIAVTSGQITGNGTNTITINPGVTFADSTGYYVQIPGTAFKNGSNYFSGISDTISWNFTTGDFTAPVISSISSGTPTSSGATITWTTNENASTRISYGLTSSYGTTTSETDTSPRVTSHSVLVGTLLSCTTYHYRVTSTDGASNTANSSDKTFTTAGCVADTTPTTTTSTSITTNVGGSTNVTDSGKTFTVSAPADATSGVSSFVVQIKAIPSDDVLASLGRPSTSPNEVGLTVFDVKAIINGTTTLDSFDAPITIEYQYTNDEIAGLNESSLKLYHYHNGAWTALTNCVVDTDANTISCNTDSFSVFGLFGEQALPGTGSGPSPGVCSLLPQRAPDLYEIDATDTTATLYFVPVVGADKYYIVYGTTPDANKYATSFSNSNSTGAMKYRINDLDKNTTYYFKVQAGNDCSRSRWSAIRSVKTGFSIGKILNKVSPKKIDIVSSDLQPVQPSPSAVSQASLPSSGGVTLDVQVLGTDKKPIAGVDVTLHSKIQKTKTDANGIAHFANVEKGDHKVILAYADYTGTRDFTVDGTQNLKLTMEVRLVRGIPYGMFVAVTVALIFVIFILLFIIIRKKKKRSSEIDKNLLATK